MVLKAKRISCPLQGFSHARASVLPGRPDDGVRPDLAFAQIKLSTEARARHQRGQVFYLHRRPDGRQCRRHPQGNPPGQDRHLGGARRLLSGREGLRPQGPLRRQSRGQRPDHDRHHAEHGRQIAGHGQAGAQADRRHLRIQGPDQHRPDRDRSRLDRTIPISAKRNSWTTRPTDDGIDAGAEGFHRGFSGSRSASGSSWTRRGFPEER